MTRKLSSFVQIIMIVALLTPITALAAQPQECKEWYARCDKCAEHLGGTGVAGPYPTKPLCMKYVDKMTAEGFRFGDCYCGASSQQQPPQQPQMTQKQAIRTVLFAVGGAAGGCAAGAAVAVKTNTADQTGGCIIGAAAGALVGLVANKVIFGFNFGQPHPSALVGRRHYQTGGFGVSVTLRLR